MKIGLISPGGFDATGDKRVVPAFLWMLERLTRDHEVSVFTMRQYPDPVRFNLLGAKVSNIGRVGRTNREMRQIPHLMRAIEADHRRSRFDVLHSLWAGGHSLAAVICGRMLGIPSVVSVLGGELQSLPEISYGGQIQRKGRMITAITLRFTDSVTCPSAQMAEVVKAKRADVITLPLGVDCNVFYPSAARRPGPPFRLLHVANLNRVKDQTTLLHAFRSVRRELQDCHLDIVGVDTLDGEIQNIARELRISDQVTFHGFQTSETVARRLREAHVLLHSSRSEAGPVVVLEAAASGVPCIGTAVGHVCDMAPESAIATPVGDPDALAESTLRILKVEDLRESIAGNALRFARRFDAAYTAREFERLYRFLAKTDTRSVAV